MSKYKLKEGFLSGNNKEYTYDELSDFEDSLFSKLSENEIQVDENVRINCINERRLLQVLINLISNAYKFTEGFLTIGCFYVNNRIRISRKDTGDGMTQEELDSLFQLFKTNNNAKNRNGTGIGLCVVKDILNAFNIKIEGKILSKSFAPFIVFFFLFIGYPLFFVIKEISFSKKRNKNKNQKKKNSEYTDDKSSSGLLPDSVNMSLNNDI